MVFLMKLGLYSNFTYVYIMKVPGFCFSKVPFGTTRQNIEKDKKLRCIGDSLIVFVYTRTFSRWYLNKGTSGSDTKCGNLFGIVLRCEACAGSRAARGGGGEGRSGFAHAARAAPTKGPVEQIGNHSLFLSLSLFFSPSFV